MLIFLCPCASVVRLLREARHRMLATLLVSDASMRIAGRRWRDPMLRNPAVSVVGIGRSLFRWGEWPAARHHPSAAEAKGSSVTTVACVTSAGAALNSRQLTCHTLRSKQSTSFTPPTLNSSSYCVLILASAFEIKSRPSVALYSHTFKYPVHHL